MQKRKIWAWGGADHGPRCLRLPDAAIWAGQEEGDCVSVTGIKTSISRSTCITCEIWPHGHTSPSGLKRPGCSAIRLPGVASRGVGFVRLPPFELCSASTQGCADGGNHDRHHAGDTRDTEQEMSGKLLEVLNGLQKLFHGFFLEGWEKRDSPERTSPPGLSERKLPFYCIRVAFRRFGTTNDEFISGFLAARHLPCVEFPAFR